MTIPVAISISYLKKKKPLQIFILYSQAVSSSKFYCWHFFKRLTQNNETQAAYQSTPVINTRKRNVGNKSLDFHTTFRKIPKNKLMQSSNQSQLPTTSLLGFLNPLVNHLPHPSMVFLYQNKIMIQQTPLSTCLKVQAGKSNT